VAGGGGDGDGVVDVDDLAINGSPLLQKTATSGLAELSKK
jgi:hypothetical protein